MRKVDPKFSTQANESFNQTKTKFVPKRVCWNYSCYPRVCCAVLQRNYGPSWVLKARESLHLPPLPPENTAKFMCREDEFVKRKKRVKNTNKWWKKEKVPKDQARWQYRGKPERKKGR